MRNILPALQEKLDSGTTTLCRCWRIERRDGVILGFTDHDLPLTIENITYEAATGLEGAALESAAGLAANNTEVRGALNSAQITEADLDRGLYDGAQIIQMLVDWTDTNLTLVQFSGDIGEITRGELAFTAELRGISEKLNHPKGRVYLKACDAKLGDTRCSLNISSATYTANATVTSAYADRVITVEGIDTYAASWFSRGIATWVSGNNMTRSGRIKSHRLEGNRRIIELWTPMPDSILSGDELTLIAGCDKNFTTCQSKFNNSLNFRGFPHIPGNTQLTTYPNRGDKNDGASLYNT